MPQCRLDILRARTDRLYSELQKLAEHLRIQLKKHMFFKKGFMDCPELRFNNSTIFLYVKTEKKTAFMFCLAILYFHPYIWVYTVGLCYLHFFDVFLFVGLEYVHDNDLPLVSNQFSMSNLRGGPGQHSARTQFKKNRHGESLEVNLALEAVTEDVQHFMSMVGGFAIRWKLEWPAMLDY